MKEAPIIPLPTCQAGDCGRVSTRRLYLLEVDGVCEGAIRLCWDCEKLYHLDENDKYESDGEL